MVAMLLVMGLLAMTAGAAAAQTPDTECQIGRERLAGHARASEGVRKLVAARAGTASRSSRARWRPATGSRPAGWTAALRRAGWHLDETLVRRPAGPIRIVSETADARRVMARLLAGEFAEAARAEPIARAIEFENLRGETVRVLELVTPTPGGLDWRHVVVVARRTRQSSGTRRRCASSSPPPAGPTPS